MEDAQIRHMEANDLDQVISIALSLPDAPFWPPLAYANALDPDARPRRVALVAVCPRLGTILGFSVASLVPPEAELEIIGVAAASQRQGLGQRLFRALAVELGAAGVRDLLLEVRASNRAALGFYRSLGFGQTALRPGYYVDPVEDAVLMRLRLE